MPSGTWKAVSFSQESKAFRPIVVIVWGFKSTVSRFEQYWNAYSSMMLTLAGMVMAVSPMHLPNA